MNLCVLMAEIIQEPQLRHTPDGLELTEMLVQFSALRVEESPPTLKAVGWGNMAKEIHQNYHQGDRILLEGRLNMNTIPHPEGYKEKRAELTVQKIHSLGTAIDTSSSQPIANTYQAPMAESMKMNSSYESTIAPSSPVVSTVGVLPQDDINEQRIPQSQNKNLDRGTYPARPAEEPDPDDIPFLRSVDSSTVKAGWLDSFEIDSQCPQVRISHNFKFIFERMV